MQHLTFNINVCSSDRPISNFFHIRMLQVCVKCILVFIANVDATEIVNSFKYFLNSLEVFNRPFETV